MSDKLDELSIDFRLRAAVAATHGSIAFYKDGTTDAPIWLYALELASQGQPESLARMLASTAKVAARRAQAIAIPPEVLHWLSEHVAQRPVRSVDPRTRAMPSDILPWRVLYQATPRRERKRVAIAFADMNGLGLDRAQDLLSGKADRRKGRKSPDLRPPKLRD
jgi:hypothetical protein